MSNNYNKWKNNADAILVWDCLATFARQNDLWILKTSTFSIISQYQDGTIVKSSIVEDTGPFSSIINTTVDDDLARQGAGTSSAI